MESSWGSPCSGAEWVDPSPSPPALVPNQPLLPSAKCPVGPGSQLEVSEEVYCQHVQKPHLEKCHETRVPLQENVSRTHVGAADTMAPIKGFYLRYYIDTGMHTRGLE